LNTNPRHRARGARIALAITAVALTAGVALEGTAVAAGAPAVATASKAKKKRDGDAKRRARLRRELARQVQRDPTVVLERQFLKKADIVNFRLPLTVRLTDGLGNLNTAADQLEIAWDDSVTPWPPGSVAPATQSVALTGQFAMELSYGDDAAGYGEVGALEARQGSVIRMQATAFDIADFPSCLSGPQIGVDGTVNISSAGARYGLLNPFSQRFRGSLYFRMSFASRIATSCGGGYTTTSVVDNSNAAPMPVRFDGTFRTSPAVTADGHVRFGQIVIDDAVTPQTSTFAYVRACTDTSPTCNPTQFPARLKLKTLYAEVLLGDINA
jgi:hypothetical protein